MAYVIIKSGGKRVLFYRKKNKNFTSEWPLASKWDDRNKAKEILDGLVSKGESNIDIKDVESALQEQTVEKDQSLKEYALELISKDDQSFYYELERVAKFLAASPYLVEELSSNISHEDGTVLQDLLHTIELGEYRGNDGRALLKDLRASRQRRRYYKDRLEVLNSLVTKTTANIQETNSTKGKDALDKLAELRGERNYNYRNSNLKKRYASLLKNESHTLLKRILSRFSA